jgi:hypothetical protein
VFQINSHFRLIFSLIFIFIFQRGRAQKWAFFMKWARKVISSSYLSSFSCRELELRTSISSFPSVLSFHTRSPHTLSILSANTSYSVKYLCTSHGQEWPLQRNCVKRHPESSVPLAVTAFPSRKRLAWPSLNAKFLDSSESSRLCHPSYWCKHNQVGGYDGAGWTLQDTFPWRYKSRPMVSMKYTEDSLHL